MTKYLVDTNIIIYHLNGDQIATAFLNNNWNDIAISFITYIEILSYNYSKEEENHIKKLLNSLTHFDINNNIIHNTINYRRIKKIKIPDAIILSTAKYNNLILVTRNASDFNNMDVEILNPFDL